ncbi:hypothetical protein GCM10009716_10160 [Streptomyces sodiiphilus]|uniref:HTH cro/C1-type domain-containing protein n=1 Tax=Streptomyces sodiiphilus TaxID=226217 RepID=A0ABP5A3K4_9ACTN
MPQWSDYSNGERIKILRGADLRQTDLAEMTGLSVVTIQKAEQDRALSLPTLLKIASALSVDTSVILGQQAPRRAMVRDDRTALRLLSTTVHDTASGYLPEGAEPVPIADLGEATRVAWDLYWSGDYQRLVGVLGPLLVDAAVTVSAMTGDSRLAAAGYLSDAYQIAACTANLLGARDLAYAAVGHSRSAAQRADEPLRLARVTSARSWVYLRDGRLREALELCEQAAATVEPRYSDASAERLTVYGNLLTHCAVNAARMEDEDRAGDYLSQVHAVGARLGVEHDFHGARFGPVTAVAQAVGVNVTIGRVGKALKLAGSVGRGQLGTLSDAARNRYGLDVAMAQADAKMYDAALDTLEETLTAAPQWARHQALPGVIVQKVGRASTGRLRRVADLIGVRPGVEGGFLPATPKTAL